MKSIFVSVCSLGLGIGLGMLSLAASAQNIQVHKLNSVPTLDGDGADWAGINATTVALTPLKSDSIVEALQVEVKAGYSNDEIFFFIEWVDSEANKQHKPYVWDEAKSRYSHGPQREDRLAMQFQISGEFTPD